MNPFECHSIAHLSVSQLNLWAAAPGIWLMERLLGRKAPVGASAHRGTAAEVGIVLALQGESIDDTIELANARFTELTAFSADPRCDKERTALPDMVRQGVGLLKPWGAPDRTQVEKNWTIEGLAVPIIGYSDLEYDAHGLIVDIKTTFAHPSEIKTAHARQIASYVGTSRNFAGGIAYVTNRKAQIYRVENVPDHIRALEHVAMSLQRFLSISPDPHELA